jgi:hypothetical protein
VYLGQIFLNVFICAAAAAALDTWNSPTLFLLPIFIIASFLFVRASNAGAGTVRENCLPGWIERPRFSKAAERESGIQGQQQQRACCCSSCMLQCNSLEGDGWTKREHIMYASGIATYAAAAAAL